MLKDTKINVKRYKNKGFKGWNKKVKIHCLSVCYEWDLWCKDSSKHKHHHVLKSNARKRFCFDFLLKTFQLECFFFLQSIYFTSPVFLLNKNLFVMSHVVRSYISLTKKIGGWERPNFFLQISKNAFFL